MRRLLIYGTHTSSNLLLNDDNLVVLQERGMEDEILTIDEMLSRFSMVPSVQATGILRTEIYDRETREVERII